MLCRRKAEYVLVNVDTGEVVPARCWAAFCEDCAGLLVWRVGLAIALAEPDRWGRLSLVGNSWDVVRGRMRRLRYDVTHAGYGMEWVWAVEANPRGTGHHAHFWWHGSYIPQGALQDLCARRGLGIPFVQAWDGRGGGERYALKAVTYGLKAADGGKGLREHLRLNGGRLVHASRGFWRDGRTGPRLAKRQAELLAVARCRGDAVPSSWQLLRRAELGGR